MKQTQCRILLDLLEAAGERGISRPLLEGYKEEFKVGYSYDRRLRQLEEDYVIEKLNSEGRPCAPSEFIWTWVLKGKREPKGHALPKEHSLGFTPSGFELMVVL